MTTRQQMVDPQPSIDCDDGRQSNAAAAIQRGVVRLLRMHGIASITEMTLRNARRADVVGIAEKGDISIVEIKSSIEDFRADNKWQDYLLFCDRFYFAVAPEFPREILPDDTGIIIADRFGGEFVRSAPEDRLFAARRKAMTLRFARAAGARLSRLADPDLPAIGGGTDT